MNVLSLFDGISAGQLALQRANKKVTNYYASEIDKYAIKITQKNFPNTIQLGNVLEINTDLLPEIDLLIGGSPCQGFSTSGRGLNFDDPRSKLFFEYVKLLRSLRPKYFLLENVPMKKAWEETITDYMGCEPVKIPSDLVSAQHRDRLYWTNIPIKGLPEDRKIYLKDIVFDDALFAGRIAGRRLGADGKRKDYDMSVPITQKFEVKLDGKSNALSTVQKDNLVVCLHNVYGGFGETQNRTFTEKSPTIRTPAGGGHIPSLILSEQAIDYMNRVVEDGRTHWDFAHHSDIRNEKSAAIVANFFKGVPYNVLKTNNLIRHFDPIECERLQTFPDNYTEGVSKTQRYKMLGNSWTVNVISWIFSFIDTETK